MRTYEFGDRDAEFVLLQPADRREEESAEREFRIISEKCDVPFRMIALEVDDWNRDLSPWEAPAVFGDNAFGGGASGTFKEIMKFCTDDSRTYIIGGYSLAGLFAIWASCRTDIFRGVAAASPSVWFPGFTDHLKSNETGAECVYLSLGDKEDKTKNPVMSTVKDKITETYDILSREGTRCYLEWNPGNHFREPDVRMAKAFIRVIEDLNNNGVKGRG